MDVHYISMHMTDAYAEVLGGRWGGISFDGVEQAKNEREHKVEKLTLVLNHLW